MTKRVTVSEANSPSPGFAEAFARLLLERERDRPALALTVEAERQTMTENTAIEVHAKNGTQQTKSAAVAPLAH